MQEKISGPIREISLTQATYSNEKIKPTLINFFYGSNGTGKSTIARSIRENTGSTLDSNLRENTDILVYNQDFIDENFSNHQNLPGVFTLDSHNIEIENRINELQKEKDTLVKQLQLNSDTLSQAQKDSSKLEQLIQDTLWKESEEFRTEFDKIQKGYKIKKNFTDKVFKIKAEKAKDLEHLRQQYNIVFNEKAKKYPLLDNFEGETSYLDELANNSLIVDPIISSSNTSFALFAKKIKANDWIRSGYQMFHSNADNRCPYCQQELPDNFEAYIASCFDQQYEENIKQLKIILEKYRSYANQFVSPVMNINLDNTLEDTDLKKLSAEIRLLSNLIRENIQSMEQKIKEPSQSFILNKTKENLENIQSIIAKQNQRISDNNSLIEERNSKKTECEKDLWDFISNKLSANISAFSNQREEIIKNINSLQSKIDGLKSQIKSFDSEIKALNNQVINTSVAMDNINTLLKNAGFQGFSIAESDSVQNAYRIIRNNTLEPANNLSEGERNFLVFLYFYQMVKGSMSSDDTTKNKIIVIDDPVSSMDSNSMYIVSSIIRELIDICENNAVDINNSTTQQFIQQIFILTHNPYFHKEVSHGFINKYRYVNSYLIRKINNVSSVELCIRNRELHPSQKENFSPVQNSYTALWLEYKNITHPIPLMNVMRRILSYYFIQLCGYNETDVRKVILNDNLDKFIAVDSYGNEDRANYIIASSILAHMYGNDRMTDGIYTVENFDNLDAYRKVFKEIFKLTNQSQHYEMMMR